MPERALSSRKRAPDLGEVGGWPAWAGRLALVGFALAVLLVHFQLTVRRPDRSVFTFDSAEYAVAGRELARTGKLATPFAFAAHLRPGDQPPFPMLVGHPLVPMLDALAFTVGGARSELTLIPPALGFLVAVLLTAALARRAGGSAVVAMMAGATFALAPEALFYASEGRSEMALTAVWAAGLVLLSGPSGGTPSLALGAVLGLGQLARPVVAPVLPVWLVAVAARAPAGSRTREAGAALMGFLPFGAGVFLHRWLASGTPFADPSSQMFLLHLAPQFTMGQVDSGLGNPPALAYMTTHPGAVLAKLARFAPSLALAGLGPAGKLLSALFAVRVVTHLRDETQRRVLLTVAALFACSVVMAGLTLPSPRLLFPLAPAFVALGMVEGERLARAARLGPRWAVGVCLVLALAVQGRHLASEWRSALAHPRLGPGQFSESDWRGLGRELARLVPRGTTVLSDAAPWIAWHADRASVVTTYRLEEVAELGRRTPLGALALTNEWVIHQPGSEAWRELYEGRRQLQGWTRADTLTSGRLRTVLFLPSSR